MHFEVYQERLNALERAATTLLTSSDGKWRWRLRADNGEPIASGESFHTRSDCMHSITLVMSTSTNTPIQEVGE